MLKKLLNRLRRKGRYDYIITDLTPRGIKSTYQTERACYNSTWVHIYREIKEIK